MPVEPHFPSTFVMRGPEGESERLGVPHPAVASCDPESKDGEEVATMRVGKHRAIVRRTPKGYAIQIQGTGHTIQAPEQDLGCAMAYGLSVILRSHNPAAWRHRVEFLREVLAETLNIKTGGR